MEDKNPIVIGRLGRDENKRTVTFYGEPAGGLPATAAADGASPDEVRYDVWCLPAARLAAQDIRGWRAWPRA